MYLSWFIMVMNHPLIIIMQCLLKFVMIGIYHGFIRADIEWERFLLLTSH